MATEHKWPKSNWTESRKELELDFVYRDDLIRDLVDDGYCYVPTVGTFYLHPDLEIICFAPSTHLQKDVMARIEEKMNERN